MADGPHTDAKLIATLGAAIRKQQAVIRAQGFDPTWNLFARILERVQGGRRLTPAESDLYHAAWDTIYDQDQDQKEVNPSGRD